MKTITNISYSVLMSVYAAEKAPFLEESIKSILSQTVPTDDFVVVCDGPLTPELDYVIGKYSDKLHVIKSPVNEGLGKALSKGLLECKNNLVVRMDSDDISSPDRVEKQLNALEINPNASIVSGTVVEFTDSITNTRGKREVPLTSEEIRIFSRKRTPFNHPSVMFKKDAVIACGGYNEEYHLFEDYYLWVRMLMNGYSGVNLKDNLVYMRVDDNTMLRRGGWSYAKDMLRFHNWMRRQKWSSLLDFVTGAIPHAVVCIMPKGIRKAVYKRLH